MGEGRKLKYVAVVKYAHTEETYIFNQMDEKSVRYVQSAVNVSTKMKVTREQEIREISAFWKNNKPQWIFRIFVGVKNLTQLQCISLPSSLNRETHSRYPLRTGCAQDYMYFVLSLNKSIRSSQTRHQNVTQSKWDLVHVSNKDLPTPGPIHCNT
ncbi:hypothetical protein H5410_010241 [Solanum commersonii]|uniref:Uncharacterized protein n=1 Tax=Solanum commersonii TaxID=4109 RepID=A0A9J6ALX3_SOLCO|nr:hypothetical protein H5410_010241 [Solanum commersonii]